MHKIIVLLVILLEMNQAILVVNANAKENDGTGITGAVPREKLSFKTAVSCEGQKMFIFCADVYDRLQIKESFYGRQDSTTCKHPKLISDKKCVEQNDTVKSVVEDLCNGELQCEISVTNDFLAQSGTIICRNIYKYLYVKYRCLPKSVLQDVPHLPMETIVPALPAHSESPVRCCYVVPEVTGLSQPVATSVGGTLVHNVGGTKTVEERIVSEGPQHAVLPHVSRVTEIIHSSSGVPTTTTYSVAAQKAGTLQATIPPENPTGQGNNPTGDSAQKPQSTVKPSEETNPDLQPTGTGANQPLSATKYLAPNKSTTIQKPVEHYTQTTGFPSKATDPKVLAQLKLITLLQRQAKGMGLTHLISINPSIFGKSGGIKNIKKSSIARQPGIFSREEWRQTRKFKPPAMSINKHNRAS